MANGIVLGGSLRCRQNPSTSATIYGSFANGTVISVTSYNSGWYQTTWTTGSTGYVMKDFVAIVGDTVQVTKNNAGNETADSVKDGWAATTGSAAAGASGSATPASDLALVTWTATT